VYTVASSGETGVQFFSLVAIAIAYFPSPMRASAQFTQLASTVTSKVAELLYAPVFVIDEQGRVITSSEPNLEGDGFEVNQQGTRSGFLRIPLNHNAGTGEIIIGTPHKAEGISPRLAQAVVELVIHQTSIQNHPPTQHQLKNQLIYDLLRGQTANETEILNRAKHLGIDLTPPRAVILIDAANYILQNATSSSVPLDEWDERRRARTVISSIVSFFHLPNDTICADLGEGQVAVLKASDTKNLGLWVNHEESLESVASSWANLAALKRAASALLQRLRVDTNAAMNIGIGRYHPGIRGLFHSYEDARTALLLGSRFQGDNRVHCLGELGVAAFVGVADEQTKIDLAKYLLTPLDHEPELLQTLNVFFDENCCPSSTAKRLSIHRNTLSYRLDKIASLTGLEPRRFDDAVQMRLCLLLRLLRGSPQN